jgi:RimJ/RimL family protein N-acetyltransferase
MSSYGVLMTLQRRLGTARRMGVHGVARAVASLAATTIWTREQLVVFRIRPEQLNSVAPQASGGRVTIRSKAAAAFRDEVHGPLPTSLATELQSARDDSRVHWVEVEGALASWGFSAPATGSWPLTETRSSLVVPVGGVCLTAFETIPAHRGRRLYPALLTAILTERFTEGAPVAYIWCRRENIASYRAIRRVGFRETAVHRYSRLLGLARRSEAVIDA